MTDITRNDLAGVVKKAGLTAERAGRIIGTLEVSLARRAVRTEERCFVLDERALAELEESLRIGAGISPAEARQILAEMESALKPEEGGRVKFLEEGTFEIREGTVKFRLVEEER